MAILYTFRRSVLIGAAVALVLAGGIPISALTRPLDALQGQPAGTCRVTGHATSGTTPLPGVSVTIKTGQTLRGATSTEIDGGFGVSLTPGQYTISGELTGFTKAEQTITIATDGKCAQTVNLQMPLAPRTPLPQAPTPAAPTASTPSAPARGANPNAAPTTAANRGRGAQPGQGNGRVQVQPQADADAAQIAAATPENGAPQQDAAVSLLLPPGFSTDAPTDSIAINGNATNIDRGMMNDRMDAIGRGMFDPSNPDGFNNFGAPGAGGDQQGPGQFAGRGGRGGPGGPGGGRGGPGGPGGRGGFGGFLGGRGAQQNRYQGSANYTFGSSALDAKPFQLQTGQSVPGYSRNSYGATIGGPVKIPGVYDGTRKTNFVLTYSGTHNSNLFDQYATVPTDAERLGDFSGAGVPLINPSTGAAFANNQIPAAMFSQAANTLLKFIPQANVANATTNNFHYVNNYGSANDTVNLRVTQNFTPAVAGGGGGRGGRGGGGFGGGRGGGRQNNTVAGWSVNMTAQLQYRRNANDSLNLDPLLGGHTSSHSLAVPISFNIRHKRTMHSVSVNYSQTSSSATNHFSGIENVAGEAGIFTGVTNPFDYGVPSLSFSTFMNVRDMVPSNRTDKRLSLSYSWTQPWKKHLLRAGGDLRLDRTMNQTDASPNGVFTFSGIYAGGGLSAPGSGLDFADFLLGLPQQATQQYGPSLVRLRDKSGDLFLQDDWRATSKLTLNLGLRYELIYPFTEANGQLYDLDVNPAFTAVQPVQAGAAGPFYGTFPAGILNPDTNNIAPRTGFAYRFKPGLVVRGGYSISYNSGSYSTIARQLAAQPPAAYSFTNSIRPDQIASPLFIGTVLSGGTDVLQNNYGVDPNYELGRVQTLNADVQKDLTQSWVVGGGYTRTTGSSLDIVRAPNRTPTGLKIDTIQAFNYQTSGGISVLNAGTFRLQRRMVKGIGGSLTYTLAKSMDNASNTGGGGQTVAQNDQDLAAEYSLSSFDRRHQINGNLSFELPFGPNKPWLHSGGTVAALLGGWRGAANYTFQTGTPLTPIFIGGFGSVANGSNGSLRADVTTGIPLAPPSSLGPLYVFNPLAFGAPATGQYGDAGRNSITGPNNSVLNAQFSRDVRMSNNRALTLQVNISNILNEENFGAVDVNVNSQTFGQVRSYRASRSAQLQLRFRF